MMDLSRVVTVDFETDPIEERPNYPPEPVGVAIRSKGHSSYHAWGHPFGNNCRKEQAVSYLRALVEDESVQILFHNAAFDAAVMWERLGLPLLPWRRMHDTMFLLFLHDPHSSSLGLKSASEALLGWPAEEEQELSDWIWEHRAALNDLVGEKGRKKISRRAGKVVHAGAWYSLLPGELVGRYAVGDVDRTEALFRYLYPRIVSAGMSDAYDRERRLLPIFMQNERTGLRVDLEMLGLDVPRYRAALEQVEAQMRSYLGASGLSFDDDRTVAAVFAERGVIHEHMWKQTAKSNQLSVSKDNLPPEAFVDPLFASAFGYRNRLVTCLKMFMEPWLEMGSNNDGYIHTSWNQVRGSRGGARTGRPSMTKPNLLNVSKDFSSRDDGYEHPEPLQLPELPLCREYVLPDEGELWLHRDFDSQEVRIFGHFESGDLAEQYRLNPKLDPHAWVKDQIQVMTGRDLGRTSVKIMNFQSLYGGGLNAISQKLKCTRQEAQQFKLFHDGALPGRKILSDEILRIVRRDEPIRTWGGRLYYVEPPSVRDGRRQTWEYKLINYLIQGSAADMTKEVICRWHESGASSHGARFLVTVYDEINISASPALAEIHMKYLREVMEDVELDVPMRSSGKIGKRWGRLEKCP